ncbi:phosphoribosyltransferase [Nocardia takedensis]|uniref:phosphoribosyltransferase n=1 Tax=Nocardia takedensis TaxID=259390 RepID=UPI003F7641DE
MSRVFTHQRVWTLVPERLTGALQTIAVAATTRARIDAVIGIANGGLIPARGVAEILDVPMIAIHARHNDSDASFLPATGRVECHLDPHAPAVPGGRILVIDDICGSGATLRTVTSTLAPALAAGTILVTATLCRNIGATHTPDIHLWDVDDWVHFPWEPPPDTDLPRDPLPSARVIV